MTTNLSEDELKVLEKLVLSRLVKLNAVILGVVIGLVLGSLLFIVTIWLVIKDGPVVGPNLALLGQFYIGYEVTYLGSLIGFGYGFLTGFVAGFVTATIYNWIIGQSSKQQETRL